MDLINAKEAGSCVEAAPASYVPAWLGEEDKRRKEQKPPTLSKFYRKVLLYRKLRENRGFQGLFVNIKFGKNKIWKAYEISHLYIFYFPKIEQVLNF